MEEQTLAFHRAVRAGYLELATAEPQRWLLVDAAQAVDAVQQTIWQRVEPFCLTALQDRALNERVQKRLIDTGAQHEPERG